jgi:hypothetical protein
MSQIKKFIDKVASAEARQSRELLIPITDAKEMRDEIMVLLLDQRGQTNNKTEDVTIVMTGGKW